MKVRNLVLFTLMAVSTEGYAASLKAKPVEKKPQEVSQAVESLQALPLDRQTAFNLAKSYLNNGSNQQAEVILKKLALLYPDDQEILLQTISLYENSNRAEQAIPLYEQLFKLAPNDSTIILSAARAYSWTGRNEQAIALYDKVIKSGKATDDVIIEYANFLYSNKQYPKATELYRAVAQKSKLSKQGMLNLLNGLVAINKVGDAAKIGNTSITHYSGDTELLRLIADISFNAKQFEDAANRYRELLQKNPDDVTTYNKLADIAMAKNDFPEVVRLSRKILALVPNHKSAMLSLARVSSWQGDFKTSLDFYNQLIATPNPDPIYYREKARVLGWMGNYKEAVTVYKSATQKWPDDKAISAEAEAKKNYYNHTYRPAVKAYNNWLLAEPQQPEALFDLAQLYSQYSKWSNGLNTYNSLLSQIPAHRQAALAKQKTDLAASKMFVRSGIEFFSAETQDLGSTNHRQTDLKSTSLYTSLSYPFNERFSAFLNLDSKSYDFKIAVPGTSKTPVTYGMTVGAEYRNMPNIALNAGIALRMNPDDIDNNINGFINANSQPIDNLHVGITLRNDDVVSNTSSFINQLEATRLQGRIAYNGFRRWQAGLDVAYDSYSDNQSYDNGSMTIGADVIAHLLYEPKRLSVSYRLQEYGFDKNYANHPRYYNYLWTPKSYTTHTFGLEWQHYLNKERFHGSNNTYYDLAFRLGLEQEGDISRQCHASIHHDWNSRLATSLEGQYTWGTSAEVYKDSMVKAEFRWFL